jgi:pimeloyl-ACP methyl ester carboxylesterase
MTVIFDAACAGRVAPLRLVMLPAAYAAPEDFVRSGFIAAVRERRLQIDLVFAGLELEHLADQRMLTRLRQEIILPARALGSAVWLGGISLGGYLALCGAERHPAELAGLCLFAPYLGSHIVTSEVERALGVASWQPGELAEGDDERRVWRFIKTLRGGSLAVHLGLGREDRFAQRHRLLASALAPADVDVVSGGHDWPTWQKLWERFLDARFAPRPQLQAEFHE